MTVIVPGHASKTTAKPVRCALNQTNKIHMTQPAVDVARALHARVQQSAGLLRVTKSILNGRVSSHVMASNTSFSSMLQFQKIAHGERCGDRSFVGSISGELVFSVNTAFTRRSESKKRKADTSSEEATRAVDRIKKSGKDAAMVTNKSYDIAKSAIGELLKIRGASGERALESWAVSLRKPGEYGAAPSADGRASLVIAVRIAAGVAISISSLAGVIKMCKDGMITVSGDAVDADFNLPMSEQCSEAHERGQRSILLLASVPHMDESPEKEGDGPGS